MNSSTSSSGDKWAKACRNSSSSSSRHSIVQCGIHNFFSNHWLGRSRFADLHSDPSCEASQYSSQICGIVSNQTQKEIESSWEFMIYIALQVVQGSSRRSALTRKWRIFAQSLKVPHPINLWGVFVLTIILSCRCKTYSPRSCTKWISQEKVCLQASLHLHFGLGGWLWTLGGNQSDIFTEILRKADCKASVISRGEEERRKDSTSSTLRVIWPSRCSSLKTPSFCDWWSIPLKRTWMTSMSSIIALRFKLLQILVEKSLPML